MRVNDHAHDHRAGGDLPHDGCDRGTPAATKSRSNALCLLKFQIAEREPCGDFEQGQRAIRGRPFLNAPTMPDHGLFDFGEKIQTEALPPVFNPFWPGLNLAVAGFALQMRKAAGIKTDGLSR